MYFIASYVNSFLIKKTRLSGFKRKNFGRGLRENGQKIFTTERLICVVNSYLTHLFSMYPFSAHWKHQKTLQFSVFSG